MLKGLLKSVGEGVSERAREVGEIFEVGKASEVGESAGEDEAEDVGCLKYQE